MRLVLIAAGGAAGSVARYLLDGLVYRLLPPTFPAGTFVVNVTGCLVFGFLVGAADQRFAMGSPGRTFWLIGLLGAFTTFSTFTFETFALLRDARWLAAALNGVGQVVMGLAALWLGYAAARVL